MEASGELVLPAEDRLELLASLLADFLAATPSPQEDQSKRQRLCTILDEYQEAPHLLDAHLEGFVRPLIGRIRADIQSEDAVELVGSSQISRVTHILYAFTKIRGAKTIRTHPLAR
jgi:hypothetical protein